MGGYIVCVSGYVVGHVSDSCEWLRGWSCEWLVGGYIVCVSGYVVGHVSDS